MVLSNIHMLMTSKSVSPNPIILSSPLGELSHLLTISTWMSNRSHSVPMYPNQSLPFFPHVSQNSSPQPMSHPVIQMLKMTPARSLESFLISFSFTVTLPPIQSISRSHKFNIYYIKPEPDPSLLYSWNLSELELLSGIDSYLITLLLFLLPYNPLAA